MEMRIKSEKILIALVVSILFLCSLPRVSSASYVFTYELLNRPGGSAHYRLNVAVSESLLQYYESKSHILISNNDYSKFITPYALKPIADCVWNVSSDDEDFANDVLMVVHQIPYEETRPLKYPVETIVANKGDCDLFSYIAASIMKAGGLDVVLFYYESEQHMNIGVSLSNEPQSARTGVDYAIHDGSRFYIAECTGGNWQEGWRVGECPDSLKNATLQVISLENYEQSAPGQVSASYKALGQSTLSLEVSSKFLIQGGSVTLSGQLSPFLQNETITFYVRINGAPWSELCTVSTDSSGHFAYNWLPNVSGLCLVRAGWSGSEDYAGADSLTVTLTVLSMFFIALLGFIVVLVVVGLAVFLISRRSHSGAIEPLPPSIPS
jgi:hypothetical protein